jgi:hypothetical protein
MTTYVLGAGASYPIYPLASKLLQSVSEHIAASGRLINRFDYAEWPEVMAWLRDNSNPLLRQAFENGNIEQIFTVLDLAESLLDDSQIDILRASKQGAKAVAAAEANYNNLAAHISEYRRKRIVLLWALENFFQDRHSDDLREFKTQKWEILLRFGELLKCGDTVITFNYDSTVERVLLALGKWHPADGYGERILFQRSQHDTTPFHFPDSHVKVLHLHGAVGWYRKPSVRQDFPLNSGGAMPPEARTPAPLETKISIDPIVLRDFGIYSVDASMPSRPPHEYQILLHPSFLKDYAGEETRNPVFMRVWKTAAEALRAADKIVIIGYSLPPADAAAWTLLLTNCAAAKTDVVNPDKFVMDRYRRLLFQHLRKFSEWKPPLSFRDWVAAQRQNDK